MTTLDMDVCDEHAIEKAAHSVKDRFGQELRLLINVSGVVSLTDVFASTVLCS